jgi:hypothetical protein
MKQPTIQLVIRQLFQKLKNRITNKHDLKRLYIGLHKLLSRLLYLEDRSINSRLYMHLSFKILISDLISR